MVASNLKAFSVFFDPSRMVAVRLLLPFLVLLLLAAPACAAEPALRPLHATREAVGGEGRVVDDLGRQVLLRGVNVNQLGDYFRTAPPLDTVVPLADADFDEIAALSMDSVRLLVHWSALEPQPGAFDQAYLARIRAAVAAAKANGIHVILDMHQDAWGKAVDTKAGETCLPGFSPAVGWDGAPAWATITDGLPTCRAALRELSPAVATAWQSFWADRDGIQGHLVDTWARLAAAFAGEPAVAGYDVLNEPNPGFALGVSGATVLAQYTARVTTAIRAAEQAAGGFSHIVFFEPGVEWSAAAAAVTPTPLQVTDPNVVFAPHLYAGSITADRSLGVEALTIERGFALAAATAAQYGSTVWSGEWGWFGDPASDGANVAEYGRFEDEHRWGGAYWDWKQACGDPHNFSAPGAAPYAVSPSLHRFACPSGKDLGIPAAFRRVLARPYPRAAPGRLTRLTSSPDTGAFEVQGRAGDGSCELDVWTPGTGDAAAAPVVTGTNVRDLAVRRSRGGWRVSGCASGAWSARSDGSTLDSAPAPRTCTSRRTVRLTPPRLPRGARAARTLVRIGAGKARTLRSRPARVTVSLAGRPRGVQRVTVTVVARDGRRFTSVRRLRTCTRRIASPGVPAERERRPARQAGRVAP